MTTLVLSNSNRSALFLEHDVSLFLKLLVKCIDSWGAQRLTLDRGAVGSSLTGVTVLCP